MESFIRDSDFSTQFFIPSCKDDNVEFQPKIKLAVLASGNGTNFESLVKYSQKSNCHFDISLLVVNKNNCGAINKAIKLNIPYYIINNTEFTSRELHEKQIIKILKHNDIEAIVMAGWMRIVTDELIQAFPNKIINIHPSLLPSFKGVNAIKQALDSGVKITGCTVHIVSKEVDSGSIVVQGALFINEHDDIISLTEKMHQLEHKLLPIGISKIAKYWTLRS